MDSSPRCKMFAASLRRTSRLNELHFSVRDSIDSPSSGHQPELKKEQLFSLTGADLYTWTTSNNHLFTTIYSTYLYCDTICHLWNVVLLQSCWCRRLFPFPMKCFTGVGMTQLFYWGWNYQACSRDPASYILRITKRTDTSVVTWLLRHDGLHPFGFW